MLRPEGCIQFISNKLHNRVPVRHVLLLFRILIIDLIYCTLDILAIRSRTLHNQRVYVQAPESGILPVFVLLRVC